MKLCHSATVRSIHILVSTVQRENGRRDQNEYERGDSRDEPLNLIRALGADDGMNVRTRTYILSCTSSSVRICARRRDRPSRAVPPAGFASATCETMNRSGSSLLYRSSRGADRAVR